LGKTIDQARKSQEDTKVERTSSLTVPSMVAIKLQTPAEG